MSILEFENDGPLIVASNYWTSEMAAAGLYVSINAGCFRLLVPQSQHAVISDMRPGAKHFVVWTRRTALRAARPPEFPIAADHPRTKADGRNGTD